MKWTDHWNTDGLDFGNSKSINSFNKRESVLNGLSKRYDLNSTKPFLKEVHLVTYSTNNAEQPISLHVSCFNFKQQV